MKLFDKFKKWKLNVQSNGLRVGKFHIMKYKRYHILAHPVCTCYGIIQDKNHRIAQLEKDLNLYKTLLDSSQQINRNYGNNNNNK